MIRVILRGVWYMFEICLGTDLLLLVAASDC